METIQITFMIEQKKSNFWVVTAKCGNANSVGDGSSKDVAVGRAADRLIKAMDDDNDSPNDSGKREFVPTHHINYGAHEDQKCMEIMTISTSSAGMRTIKVQYADGTFGDEKERFLRPIKKGV